MATAQREHRIRPVPRARTARTTDDATQIADLLVGARAGDRRAFSQIVERCAPMVRSVARRYLINPADVEDVTQEVWLSLAEHLDRIEQPSATRAWLCRVTTNAAWRLQGRKRRASLYSDVEEWASGDDTEELGLRDLRRDEIRRTMRQALARLKPNDRRLIELLMMDDRPDYRTVSRVIDRPVGSIGPSRQRAFARLRRQPTLARLWLEASSPAA